MTNTISKPTWYYKPIDIDADELSAIQEEFNKSLDLILDARENGFYYIRRDNIESLVPNYVKMLDRMNLLDRWIYSAVITTQGHQEFPIHVDSMDWEHRCYGLNIPILNCHDSWTVWYDADIDPISKTDEHDPRNSARFCSTETAVEICRMPASTPAWVNVSIPHRPITMHGNLRAIVSARFNPELHDILENI